MDIKVAIPHLKHFIEQEKDYGIETILSLVDRKQLSELSGIKYYRVCLLLRKKVSMKPTEVNQIAKIFKIRQSLVRKFIARPIA